MGQSSCYHISMNSDIMSSEYQHDDVLEQAREDELADMLQCIRQSAAVAPRHTGDDDDQ